MNILVVAHYQNDGSPSAIFVHDQVKAYVAAGHAVRVIVPLPIGKRAPGTKRLGFGICKREIDGAVHCFLRYVSLSNFGSAHFNTASAVTALWSVLPRVLKGFRPDVIHAHTLGFDSEIGVWLKKKLGCPLVVTTHGSDTSIPVEQGNAAALKPWCDHVDRVVAVSSALADKLRTCGTQTPVSVILNGFQSQALPASMEKRPFSFIQVGHLLEQKRVYITVQAFAALKKRYPEASLTLIGQGPERERLETLCLDLGVKGSVRFSGQIPNQEVLSEMGRTRFFVMPSVREGFGIVYLEAMACGCVTIGTEGEGIADLIVNGVNGFLVPPDNPDAIVRVIDWCLQNPEQTEAIAERSRKDARSLTWENNAAQYIQLFNSLIERK